MSRHVTATLAFALLLGLSFGAPAEPAPAELQIKGHKFQPAELKVPAGQRIKLTVHNKDASPEEFESHELRVEKIVTGNNSATVYFGPLEPGDYPFFGEFHQATAQGKVIAE